MWCYISDRGLRGRHTDMDEWYFLEIEWRQNWTFDHYNPRRAQQNIRYIDQGRWSVDLSKRWSTKKLRCDIFDYTCCLDAHIAKLCRSINFNLFSIGKIRKYLDGPTAEKMINATVTYRLDYSNSLLYGAKQSHIDRLVLPRITQPGLYLNAASLTVLALCWKNCNGFPWSIGSVIKFCS